MTEHSGSRHWARWPPLLFAVLVLLASLRLAISYPLVDPDEGRNAEIAREMATSGDLLVPHLAAMPYLDKPPGFFWAGALAIQVLGPTPLAVRLPSVLAAFATLIVLARLAMHHLRLLRSGDRGSASETLDDRFALRAVALLAVAPLFAMLSAYVIFDMMLSLCVTIVWTELVLEIR